MSTLNTIRSIQQKIKPNDYKAAEYLFDCVQILKDEDSTIAQSVNKEIRQIAMSAVRSGSGAGFSVNEVERYYDLAKRTYLFGARDYLDDYLMYLEWDRKPEEKFYLTRRAVMKQVVDKLQRFVDGSLDEYFISMPPRVGKTTLLMFFNSWMIGRRPETSNLYCAYSDVITSAFYRGTLEIITDPVTYKWKDVFPTAKLVETNAKDETLNIDRKKRYPSLTCRSLYGTLNGACDCNNLLVADDLIGGIEEALNRDRLVAAWSKTDNNLIPRAKEHAKILWCGTRWSMIDPAGLRMDLLQNDDTYKTRKFEILNLSALDENDESRFHYPYGVGYSTIFYHQRRASYERNNDMASWLAQYCGEPVERDGTLFSPDDLLTYNGVLPPGEPDRIFMAVDPAWGGSDFVAAPICYDYGGIIHVQDVVYNDGDKKITRPLIVEAIKKYNVQAAHFEANKMTADYKDWIDDELKRQGYRLNITSRPAPNDKAKEVRIFDRAPEIREFKFLDNGKRSKEYSQFMQNVYSFKIKGGNKHDDAPDSLAIAVEMVRGVSGNQVSIFKRPF